MRSSDFPKKHLQHKALCPHSPIQLTKICSFPKSTSQLHLQSSRVLFVKIYVSQLHTLRCCPLLLIPRKMLSPLNMGSYRNHQGFSNFDMHVDHLEI